MLFLPGTSMQDMAASEQAWLANSGVGNGYDGGFPPQMMGGYGGYGGGFPPQMRGGYGG